MKLKSVKKVLVSNALTLATLGGVLVGIVLGVCLRTREDPYSKREAMYVKFVGTLFLSMLKCIIIPLIIPSLIVAVGSLDLKISGKVGARGVLYYMSTTIIAVILGIILVTTIQPGKGATPVKGNEIERNITTEDTLMDLVRNIFPPNIIQACTKQVTTDLMYLPTYTINNETLDKRDWAFKTSMKDNTNILGLVVFSLVFGVAIAAVGEEGEAILKFFSSLVSVMMKVTGWVINLAPVGVLFLVAGSVIEMEDPAKTFESLGWYFATVILGLSIHGLLILPLIYGVMTRSLPFKFIGNMSNALATAFGTASSSATLPVTIDALENNNKIDPRITRFILPIGATINMDGTALYEAVAAIFIAQVRGITLDAGKVIAISITATAASIGAAGIPQAGLVTMVMVLQTVGLPSSDVALILAVDWLLDRFRTAINVLGDAIGAGIVYHLSKNELSTMDQQMEENTNENNGTVVMQEISKNGQTNKAFDEKIN